MHTYKIVEAGKPPAGHTYGVGYYQLDGIWRTVRTFDNEITAAAFVNYLNGGRGKDW